MATLQYYTIGYNWIGSQCMFCFFAGNVPLLACAPRELCIHCKIMTHFSFLVHKWTCHYVAFVKILLLTF
jgi:hypothetical protein